jgi:hypothetical protein
MIVAGPYMIKKYDRPNKNKFQGLSRSAKRVNEQSGMHWSPYQGAHASFGNCTIMLDPFIVGYPWWPKYLFVARLSHDLKLSHVWVMS